MSKKTRRPTSATPLDTRSPRDARYMLARAFPYGVALTLAATFVGPFGLNASIVTAVGTTLGAALALAGMVLARRALPRETVLAGFAVATALTLFSATSAFSANPAISFVGAVGQHNGTALWALGGVWLLAGVLCADSRALRETLLVITLAGVAFAGSALREAVSSGLQRFQGSAAGQFENSTSLGEFLAIAMIAGLAWGLSARQRWQSFAAALAVLALGSGLVLAESRTALLGLFASACFTTAVVVLPLRRNTTVALVVAPVLAALVASTVGVLAARGTLGATALRFVSVAGTDRDVIWRSAFAHFARAPILGSGLEQFSSWAAIGVAGGTAAFDPHNVVLAVAVGAGVVGLLVAGAALAALVLALVAATGTTRRSIPLALAASLPVALLGEGLVSWMTPAAVLGVLAVGGALLGASSAAVDGDAGGVARRGWFSAAVMLVAGLSLVLGLVTSRALPTMLSFVRDQNSPNPTDLALQYERWPDPSYTVLAIRQLIPVASDATSAQRLRSVMAKSAPDTTWRADAAAAQILAASALSDSDPASLATVVALAEKGEQADPTTGLWWFLVASHANRLGLAAEANTYAAKALQYPLPADVRETMLGYASR